MKRSLIALSMFLGLLVALLSSCGSSGTTGSAAGTPTQTPASGKVQVTLQDSHLESSRTTFMAGQAYTFVVTNKGSSPHNFIIDIRRKAPAPQGPQDRILYMVDQSQLPPGATKTFTYTFPLSTPESSVQFATHLGSIDKPGVVIPVDVRR